MIAASRHFDQSMLPLLLELDPVVADYRAFFLLLDWSVVDRWASARSSRGRPGHPETAYLKALLVRIREGFQYTTQLRAFLVKHPLLVIELGFHLVLDACSPYGLDVEQTLPTRFWFGEKLRSLDRTLLTDLLAVTVKDLQVEIPGLGEVVSFDVKHLYAWVKENNPRVMAPHRSDKTQRLKGDPDCRLGVKRSTNRQDPDGSSKEQKEVLWGYGSGVAAATTADYGDVVLAEYTRPFNAHDITFFRPLYQQAVVALNQFPMHVTADAAFDAWYVYEAAVRHGGIGAVPRNQHGHPLYERDADGVPRCSKGLRMLPTFQFDHPSGYRAQHFCCPLLHPSPTSETCTHEQFAKGKGCVKDLNWHPGALMRVTLDRQSPLYRAVYVQRTACERINSQAKELGLERPRVHNGRSVANLNTLTYLLINLRALQRVRSINAELLSLQKGVR